MRLRHAARRVGFDLYPTASRAVESPLRLGRVPPVGPLNDGRRAVPEQFCVSVDSCTSFLGFAFGQYGWNPLVETLREYEADSSLRYEESTLANVHRRFQPTTLGELFFDQGEIGAEAPWCQIGPDRQFFRYIWLVRSDLVDQAAQIEPRFSTNYYFGPLPLAQGRGEFTRLISAYESIRDRGFQPDVFGDVTGYFVADEISHRFVVGSGNHRVAALAALGVTEFPARLHSHPAVVHRSQLDWWSASRGGPFPESAVEAVFDLLLHEDGPDRARALDLGGGKV